MSHSTLARSILQLAACPANASIAMLCRPEGMAIPDVRPRSNPTTAMRTICPHSIRVIVLMVVACGISSSAAAQSTPAAGWIELFNGRDLTGWVIEGTKENDNSGEK